MQKFWKNRRVLGSFMGSGIGIGVLNLIFGSVVIGIIALAIAVYCAYQLYFR